MACDTTGIRHDEIYDHALVDAYRQGHAYRQQQLKNGVPQNPSDEYKHSLTLQYQRLRDLHKVCFILTRHEEGVHVPIFVTQCRKKEIKYRAKMDLLLLAFPFLQRINRTHFDNDI